MEKIKSAQRKKVLLKTGFLLVAPPFLMVLAVFVGNLGQGVCLFNPSRNGYWARYDLERLYPDLEESTVSIEVDYEGPVSVVSGGTELWENVVDKQGKYRLSGSSSSYYTLFWMPVFSRSVPLLSGRWTSDLTASGLVDVTGFLGPPNQTYAIALGRPRGGLSLGGKEGASGLEIIPVQNPMLRGDRWRDENDNPQCIMYFLGAGEAVAGMASYDGSSGLLLNAMSFARQGLSLTLRETNFPTNRMRMMLLPFVLATATALAFYEMFWSSVKESGSGDGLPVPIEFAIIGYSAVLVDVYFDFFYFHLAGTNFLLAVHFFMVFLIWLRLGWWAALPAMEIAWAVVVWMFYGTIDPVFTYFPASLSAWFLALMIQGALSPGTLPKLPERKKM
ncbi:MAG TPA: hypothetical protein VM658_08365 [bacterium]|nr:hypothetical protein [bacterium]